jgi:hypothetical protein
MSRTFQLIAHLSRYPVTASITLHEQGEEAWYSIRLGRRYKDASGTWRSTDAFATDDLALVAEIASQAHSEIEKLEAAERSKKPAGPDN